MNNNLAATAKVPAKSTAGCAYSFDEIPDDLLCSIGAKATNLVKMRRAGISVPPGYCITFDTHLQYQSDAQISDALIEEIAELRVLLGGKIAIRSSASCEDGDTLTMAGVFRSHFVHNDSEIEEAIRDIFNQCQSTEVDNYLSLHGLAAVEVRMALVVQKLIDPDIAGVIYTRVNGDEILVQYTEEIGTRLVDGITDGSAMLVQKDGTIRESIGFDARPVTNKMVTDLMTGIKAVEALYSGPQDIEFAFQNGTLYILQTRPLTTILGSVELVETPEDCLKMTQYRLRKLVAEEVQSLGTSTAIFSDSNYSEILPRPTEMDIGLHAYVWGGSDGVPGAKQLGHQALGYLISNKAIGIIKYIGGRTYASIGCYAQNYYIGFPESLETYNSTLVNYYLSEVARDTAKGAYPQMGLFLENPTLAELEIHFGKKAKTYFDKTEHFAAAMKLFAQDFSQRFYTEQLSEIENFITACQSRDFSDISLRETFDSATKILEHIRTVSYVAFVKAARLGFFYSKNLRMLLKERLGLSDDEADTMYSRLNQGLDYSVVTQANLAIANAVSDAEALDYALKTIGHYSTGEMLEIRHPVLRDEPEKLAAYVRGIRKTGTYREDFERQKKIRIDAEAKTLSKIDTPYKLLFEEVMKASQTYMALRETVKFHIARENLLLKDALEKINTLLNLQPGDVYFVYPRELSTLVFNPHTMLHLIAARRTSFKNYALLDLPHVIRESDIDTLQLVHTHTTGDFSEARGRFLSEGIACEGVVVNIDEHASVAEANSIVSHYRENGMHVILVATQMNLTHDPMIAQATGLVIENAGIVAHGAQRARELGKGAIAGILSRRLTTGMRVYFDPALKMVRRVI